MNNVVKLAVPAAPNPYTPRLYRNDYASGSAPGYCKTLESATVAALRKLLLDGFEACTISCMISGQDIVRMRVNEGRTKVTTTTVRPWEKRV